MRSSAREKGRRNTPLKRRTPLRSRGKQSSITRMADRLCAELVKERDGHRCRKCGVSKDLEWAHLRPRRFGRVRWEPLNTVTLCRPCHSWLDKHPHAKDKWALEQIGPDAYEDLCIRAEDDSLPRVKPKDALAELRALREAE